MKEQIMEDLIRVLAAATLRELQLILRFARKLIG